MKNTMQNVFIDVAYDKINETIEFVYDDQDMNRKYLKLTIEQYYNNLASAQLSEMTPEYLENNYFRSSVAARIEIFFKTWEHSEFMRLSESRLNYLFLTHYSHTN